MLSQSNNLLNELSIHGHVVLDGTELVSLIDLDQIEFGQRNSKDSANIPISNVENIDKALSFIQTELARKYIESSTDNYEIVDLRQIWESSPDHHKIWHNDSTEKSNDMFFLLYFSDQRPTNDGAIIIKNRNGEHRYVPYPGLLIAIENSSPEWVHMVEPSKTKRVVASLSFKINRK